MNCRLRLAWNLEVRRNLPERRRPLKLIALLLIAVGLSVGLKPMLTTDPMHEL